MMAVPTLLENYIIHLGFNCIFLIICRVMQGLHISIKGTIVRRHRIRKPAPNDDCYYTVHDFNVGMNLELYGRVYRLVACDKFTANFLRRLGVRVNEPEPVPDDPYTVHRISVRVQCLVKYQEIEILHPETPIKPRVGLLGDRIHEHLLKNAIFSCSTGCRCHAATPSTRTLR